MHRLDRQILDAFVGESICSIVRKDDDEMSQTRSRFQHAIDFQETGDEQAARQSQADRLGVGRGNTFSGFARLLTLRTQTPKGGSSVPAPAWALLSLAITAAADPPLRPPPASPVVFIRWSRPHWPCRH